MEFQNQARACRPELIHMLLLLLLTFFLLSIWSIAAWIYHRDVFEIKTNLSISYRGISDIAHTKSNAPTLPESAMRAPQRVSTQPFPANQNQPACRTRNKSRDHGDP